VKILLGVTGSVAATLTPKLYKELSRLGEVIVVATDKAEHFFEMPHKRSYTHTGQAGVCWWWNNLGFGDKEPRIFDDKSEWALWHKKGDPVQHIDLCKWADICVIAPLTANTLAKMANGICDNLLTSLVRAWNYEKPMFLAPAMNEMMWSHPLTFEHLQKLRSLQYQSIHVIDPATKMLACGDVGKGAMADIGDVVKRIEIETRWGFPLQECFGIPIENHPGAFGYQRRKDMHTGVDLYTYENTFVFAVESGEVIKTIPFTGAQLGHDWWLNTDAILVAGPAGVVCYGEIRPDHFEVGDWVRKGQRLGVVTPVIQPGKERPDIKGHSRSMLHIELYRDLYKDLQRGICEGWEIGKPQPDRLLNPTDRLIAAAEAVRLISPIPLLTMD